MGIDGFSLMLPEPIQVKQSEGIGRNVVDNFEDGGQARRQDGWLHRALIRQGCFMRKLHE